MTDRLCRDGFPPVESGNPEYWKVALEIQRAKHARFIPAEDAILEYLWLQNELTCAEIGAAIGRPAGSISGRAGLLGLPPKTPGPKP